MHFPKFRPFKSRILDRAQFFGGTSYGYVINALKKNWKSIPYHLFNAILENISHFATTDKQCEELTEALNKIHGETQDAFVSTMIWDALASLGALEDDAKNYIPEAQQEIKLLLESFDIKENWSWASSMYDRQFDHPYAYAYQIAINDLDEEKKKVFYEMALRGTSGYFFASEILIESTIYLGEAVCPLIEKWMEDPIFEKTTPQDSLKVFLLSYLIYSKHKHSILSRFSYDSNPLNKSLLAAAEIYYWINRSDLNQKEKTDKAAKAVSVLFDPENQYSVDTIYECRNILSMSDNERLWGNVILNHIEDFFSDACLIASRSALQCLNWQKDVLGFNRDGSEVDRHAVNVVERLGSLIDLDVLRPLIDHSKIGKSAVEAIKCLSRKAI